MYNLVYCFLAVNARSLSPLYDRDSSSQTSSNHLRSENGYNNYSTSGRLQNARTQQNKTAYHGVLNSTRISDSYLVTQIHSQDTALLLIFSSWQAQVAVVVLLEPTDSCTLLIHNDNRYHSTVPPRYSSATVVRLTCPSQRFLENRGTDRYKYKHLSPL